MENTNYWNWSPMCTQNHIQKSKDVDGSRLDQSTPILSVNASHVKNCTVQGAWNRFNSLCPFLEANVNSLCIKYGTETNWSTRQRHRLKSILVASQPNLAVNSCCRAFLLLGKTQKGAWLHMILISKVFSSFGSRMACEFREFPICLLILKILLLHEKHFYALVT